jgi:hypothetical protein
MAGKHKQIPPLVQPFYHKQGRDKRLFAVWTVWTLGLDMLVVLLRNEFHCACVFDVILGLFWRHDSVSWGGTATLRGIVRARQRGGIVGGVVWAWCRIVGSNFISLLTFRAVLCIHCCYYIQYENEWLVRLKDSYMLGKWQIYFSLTVLMNIQGLVRCFFTVGIRGLTGKMLTLIYVVNR